MAFEELLWREINLLKLKVMRLEILTRGLSVESGSWTPEDIEAHSKRLKELYKEIKELDDDTH